MNKSFKNITVLVVLLVAFYATSSLYAGDKDRIGTAAAAELQIPVGGKNFAMAGSDIAGTSGIDAIYWNPAGLALQKTNEVLFTTMNYFGDAMRVNYLAASFNSGGAGTFGLYWKSLDAGDIPLTTNLDPYNVSGATFTPIFTILGFTWSNQFTDAISFGLNFNYISEQVPQASASAFAFDFGLQYRNLGSIQGLDFGVVAKNIGSDMTYDGSAFLHGGTIDGSLIPDYLYAIPVESFDLPTNYQIGLSYTMGFSPETSLKVSGAFISENLGVDKFPLGAEFVFDDMVFARLGYIFAEEISAGDNNTYSFTGGLGLKFDLGGDLAIQVDYVYQAMEYFDGNNLLAIGLAF